MINPFEQAERKELLTQIGHNTPTDVLKILAELSTSKKAIEKLRKSKAMLKMFM